MRRIAFWSIENGPFLDDLPLETCWSFHCYVRSPGGKSLRYDYQSNCRFTVDISTANPFVSLDINQIGYHKASIDRLDILTSSLMADSSYVFIHLNIMHT